MENFKTIINKTIKKFKKDKNYNLNLSLPCFELVKKSDPFLNYINDNPKGSGLYYTFLYNITKHLKPKNIVELGNREGCSTLSILSGLSAQQNFITIDIEKDLRFIPNDLQKKDNFVSMVGSSIEPNVVNSIKNEIDFLFIDTFHSYKQIKKEWELWMPKLKKGAIVAIDDITYTSGAEVGMIKFIEDVKQFNPINEPLLHSSGFLIFQYM